MSDYDLYVRHDHYHHIVAPNQSSYLGTGNDGDNGYDDSPSSTDSSSDTSSYADSDTTPDNTCIDANHDGQCDATEVSQPDCEPCQDISQDNGIADASNCSNSNDADGSSDCGGYDSGYGSGGDCGCDSGGGSGDGSSSN